MQRAIARHFQGVVWQRCQVHFVRNLLNHTAARDKAAVLAQVKTITEAPTLTAARKAIGEAMEALGRRNPRAAALLEEKTRFAILRTFGKSTSIKTMTYRLAPRH